MRLYDLIENLRNREVGVEARDLHPSKPPLKEMGLKRRYGRGLGVEHNIETLRDRGKVRGYTWRKMPANRSKQEEWKALSEIPGWRKPQCRVLGEGFLVMQGVEEKIREEGAWRDNVREDYLKK